MDQHATESHIAHTNKHLCKTLLDQVNLQTFSDEPTLGCHHECSHCGINAQDRYSLLVGQCPATRWFSGESLQTRGSRAIGLIAEKGSSWCIGIEVLEVLSGTQCATYLFVLLFLSPSSLGDQLISFIEWNHPASSCILIW